MGHGTQVSQTSSVNSITWTPVAPEAASPQRPGIGTRIGTHRTRAGGATGPLNNATVARTPTKQALCDAIRTTAEQARSAAERGSLQEASECRENLLAMGNQLLSSISGKHLRQAIGAALRAFRHATADGVCNNNLWRLFESCSILSQQFDRIIGDKQPSTQAKPPSKLAISTFILGHARIVASLATSKSPRIGKAKEVKQLTDKLIAAGKDMRSALGGRQVRAAVLRAIRDFERALAQPVDPKDPGNIADICLNYAALLDEIVGIKRPEDAYNYGVAS